MALDLVQLTIEADASRARAEVRALASDVDGVGSAAKRAEPQLSAAAEAAKRMAGQASGLDKVTQSMRDMGDRAQGLSGALQGALGSFAGFLSAQAVMGAVGAGFRFAVGAAIDMNSTLETSTLQFSTLMNNS